MRPTPKIAWLLTLVPILACNCATIPPGQFGPATLAFARPAAAGELPGRFTRLDERSIVGAPSRIQVPAGKHTIAYQCPNTISVDALPTVRATFVAGGDYVMECDGEGAGNVVVR